MLKTIVLFLPMHHPSSNISTCSMCVLHVHMTGGWVST